MTGDSPYPLFSNLLFLLSVTINFAHIELDILYGLQSCFHFDSDVVHTLELDNVKLQNISIISEVSAFFLFQEKNKVTNLQYQIKHEIFYCFSL